MLMDWSDKVVVVTGATRGIGQAILEMLAKTGAHVVGTATTEAGVEKIRTDLAVITSKGHAYLLNIADSAMIEVFFEQLKQSELLPDILINNAGITRDNLMLRMKDEEWDQVIQTNLAGVFRLMKASLRSMMKKRWGRIISIGSIVGTIGNAGQANYCAAKAGVVGLSKSLAHEVASRGITVNVVSPGFIQTDMTAQLSAEHREALLKTIPLGRIGVPEDIAHAVRFLIEADYITGATIHVNGGMVMV